MDIQKEREAPNTEFNETINLVEAVLERLEFHAFEEVLIWSEEHASKALLRCLKKTLSEFKNGHLVLTSSYPKLKHFSVDNVVRGLMTVLSQAQEHQSNLNREIDELKDQLAKAQAVPEGFVLVSKDKFESLNEFKDLYKRAIINARKRKDQLNWAHVAGLGVGSGRAVQLCKMLGIDPCATNMHEVIEAQEQNA